jgi:glycosidase
MGNNSAGEVLSEIEKILLDLYGREQGKTRYEYLVEKWKNHKKTRVDFNPELPYDNLKGKIFAIAYPDNIYKDDEYTLRTLSATLKSLFPSIRGIHILPERTMSHKDIWPQDFFHLVDKKTAKKIVESLERLDIIDQNRIITPVYSQKIHQFTEEVLPDLLGPGQFVSLKDRILSILKSAFNSHFNDGGFSQKTRAMVDPRFGTNDDLIDITSSFAVMLDYVVNHLDVDNDYIEEFRNGNNDGEAFIIIYRDRYKQLIADGTLEKTFRPRPYPLFTGLRKYPVSSLEGEIKTLQDCAEEMNRIFSANGLERLDERLILFLSIFFKIENDQGLSSEDKRIFRGFEDYTLDVGLDVSSFWKDSEIQEKQKVFNPSDIKSMADFLVKMGKGEKYADLFMNDSDHIFGREFYIYTTFSESQADVNPLSFDGFAMIIDDLFHLFSSGTLAMMRMDAIKYLWKEIGSINFDMEEGNKLIKVIRLLMQITCPSTLPLDEVNSPDPVVYDMTRDGGFAYLFGQVNAVPAAFNMGNLEPLIRFNRTLKEKCPESLVRFVMLSTHDGRSVQGLGVQRSDGHVSIEQFYNFKDTVKSRGGKPKFRTVTRGEITGDTFRKVFKEAGYEKKLKNIYDLFDEELIVSSDLFRLKDRNREAAVLLEQLSLRLDSDVRTLSDSAAVDFFIQWIIYGKTDYELCCTSRSSFAYTDSDGNTLSPDEEAKRLAAAQLFVLTQGQDVPAIYVNDLFGLENDLKSYEISGKPRDLNRHKSSLSEVNDLIQNDPFTKSYTALINMILKLRAEDEAFYPGSRQFQFLTFGEGIFVNHPWHKNKHSLIAGNILNKPVAFEIEKKAIENFNGDVLKDMVSGKEYACTNGKFHIEMNPYGFLWLK